MSDSQGEPPPASPHASGIKVLETLKKHMFETQSDSHSKSLSSREVCSSFSDLTAAVFATSQRANSAVVVSGAVELLVHACSSQDRGIRLAGKENLHKLVKGLQFTHLSRLQQDLFHELKKNGNARSLNVALEVFAALFPSTRPSRRQTLSQSLLPVLLRLLARADEALHEALQESLSLILPTMTPFISSTNLQLLMSALLERLPQSPASYRRMTACALNSLVTHSKSPATHTHWLVGKMLMLGFHGNATKHTCQGILLTLQTMSGCHDKIDVELLKQVYGFVLSCMLYRDGNTAVAAMETMNSIIVSASSVFSDWLLSSPSPPPSLATQVWVRERGEGERREGEGEGGSEDGLDEDQEQDCSSDAHSLGEDLTDDYFDSDKESVAGVSETHLTSEPGSAPVLPGCLGVMPGPTQPLTNLVLYLQQAVLPSSRVSAVAVGLTCLTSCANLAPSLFPSLAPYLPYTTHHDPKLKSNSAKLLAVLLRAVLRESRSEASGAIVSEAAAALHALLNDSSPVVLKAVCESLRVCLPSLGTSSQPKLAVALVQSLLTAACSTSYWLAKVELLRTLACLPVTALALSLPSLPNSLLSRCVFPLLEDPDHRVRTAAAEAMSLLVPSLQLTSDPVLAHAQWELSREFPSLHSHSSELSLASAGLHGSKTIPPTPLGLQHVLWFLVSHVSSSESHSLQKGCLEALHMLCEVFPPSSLPSDWGCQEQIPSLLPITTSLLTASHLAWTVQGQQQLLDVCAAVFLACCLTTMTRAAQTGQTLAASDWAALSGSDLVNFASLLLRHMARLLAVFVHVIEGREPETRETRRVPVVSPKKPLGREESPISASSGKPKVQIIENLQRPPLVPRDGIGQFASHHHYLKILDACRSAYTNYQVSLSAVGDDKFSHLLQSTHNMVATLLEVAMATDVGKHVEELMTYFSITFKVDPSGALLCVQQLLNALFGMNVATQHNFIHSPFLSSLTFELYPLQKAGPPSSSSPNPTITQITLSQPLTAMEAWLEAPPPHPHLSPSSSSPPLLRKRGLFSSRRALVVKPVNSVSSVKDYISYFEPLVVSVVKRFPHTSSLLLQQRTLFLLVQLLQLKVRYELLDCNHTFLESVLKLVGLMETGVVRDGEDLVPFLFHFLVLLAYDNSQLMSIPQVMQRCDGVMASGHSVDTFAIPALQPLVLTLFVRPGKEDPNLETQREVVLSMLLRVVDHSRVLSLLTHVLDCFSHGSKHWQRVSSQILACLLNAIGRLSIALDSPDSMTTLYQLFSAMDPATISMKALFVALLKQSVLTSVRQLCRWLAVFNIILTLLRTLFPDSTLYSQLSGMSLAVPGVRSEEVEVKGEPADHTHTETTPTRLAWFLLGVLRVAAETEQQLQVRPGSHPQPLLPQLLGCSLLLLHSLLSGAYGSLCVALSSLSPLPSAVAAAFLSLAPSYPLLTLHYAQLALLAGEAHLVSSVIDKYRESTAPSHLLLLHCLLPIATSSSSQPGRREEEEEEAEQLMEAQLSRPADGVHALQVARGLGSVQALRLLCHRLSSHALSAVSSPAVSLAVEMVADMEVSPELASELMTLLTGHKHRCPELVKELQRLGGHSGCSSPSLSHPLQSTVTVQPVTKLWYLSEVYDLCVTCTEAWLCGRVLARLSSSELTDILEGSGFRKGLLEVCLSHGLELSLSPMTTLDSAAAPSQREKGPHPLLQASHTSLLRRVVEDSTDPSLLSPLLWLLISQKLLNVSRLDDATATAILTLVRHCLLVVDHSNTAAVQTALDSVSMALALPEVEGAVNEEWVSAVVRLVTGVLEEYTLDGVVLDGGATACDTSLFQLIHSALTSLLTLRPVPPLGLHLATAVLSLARLPSLHTPSLTPPLLVPQSGLETVSEQTLDQALLEGEVLQQYMARSNCVGWLSRPQFEERWMQLLGVVNQPPPSEGMPVEEVYAHTLNMCVGMVGVVSLLLATSLRPESGNPVSGVSIHTHRNHDVLFLGTKPGKHLSSVRCVIERHLLLRNGARTNLLCHYQHPLLAHLSLPLFTRNMERGPGDMELGPGQLSLKSLWPVTLLGPTSPVRSSPDGGEVDVRSCVLSLIDLFSHWLSQPVHCLSLLNTLRAVLMLSDLFSQASQFQWMLQLSHDLSDKHPPEDSAVHAILIHSLLKAAAVLKVDDQQVEKIARITEKALASDSVHVQNGCLCGLLYVAEDQSSPLAGHLSPSLTKYLLQQLESFHRHTERHCSLCWSLGVSLALHHSQFRETEFPGQLLERAIPQLLHPHTSSLLFHSLCLGLELLVINFTLSTDQRSKVIRISASRCAKCEVDKLLPALGLLVSAMYTVTYSGEVSGSTREEVESETAAEVSAQTREHISILMEQLRHGPLEGVKCLVDVIPIILTDFLPPIQVLQMIVTEFVSPHQPRPTLAAVMMGETFSILLARNLVELVTDWVLLSMDSFVQQEPESKAVWCLVCLLTAASSSYLLRTMLEVVANQPDMSLFRSRPLLATAASHFYCSQATLPQQQILIEKFQTSSYQTLNAVAHTCLHS